LETLLFSPFQKKHKADLACLNDRRASAHEGIDYHKAQEIIGRVERVLQRFVC